MVKPWFAGVPRTCSRRAICQNTNVRRIVAVCQIHSRIGLYCDLRGHVSY